VENTIGRLCAEKKQELGIDEAEFFADKNRQLQTRRHMDSQLTQYREWLLGITILDPACGSGAFLNAAFKFLKSEHEKVFEMMKRITGYELPLDQIDNEILEHNLYGVDINEESVEIAQLALWLRTAKPRRKLNTLSENIKCGNSLISDPAIAGDKAFDWQKEFPQVFEKGGFDVVIGNPPYGAKVSSEEIKVFINSFSDWGISKNLTDTYFVFYAKSLNDLVKPGGLLGFIAPNTWKLIAAAKLFRNKLLNTNYEVYKIAQYQDKVFADATVDCDTVMVQKESNPSFIQIDFVKNHEIVKTNTINQNLLASQSFFNLYLTETDYQIKSKILKESRLVEDELIIKNGVKPYEKGKGTPPQTAETLKTKPFTSETKIDESFSPLIGGSYFHRYRIMWNNDYWIKYGEWLAAPREKSTFDAEAKLIFRQTSDSLIGSFIGKGYIMRNNTHIILPKDDTYDLKYVLACLNSKLLNYYYWTINPEKGEAMAEVKAFHLGLLPIKRLSKADQQPFITLADRMLSLNKELQEKRSCFQEILTANLEGVKITTALQTFDQMDFKGFVAELKKQKITIPLTQQNEWIKCFNQNKEACQALTQQISETDREIDTRVFDLYGLTPEEREIVMKG
ncbi:MAG: N-6 DNA methylase, partial [Bacteroidaceae bacterium]|nr:N-6 DNA methylase [Bacteroidaceae bacterium]